MQQWNKGSHYSGDDVTRAADMAFKMLVLKSSVIGEELMVRKKVGQKRLNITQQNFKYNNR